MKSTCKILLMMIFSFTLVTAQESNQQLSLEDIFKSNQFRTRSLRGLEWMDDGKSFIYQERNEETELTNFLRYDIATGKRQLIIAGSQITAMNNGKKPFRFRNSIWSPKHESLLFTGTQRARRTKSSGNFYLFDLPTKNLHQLTDTDRHQVNVKFSPDGQAIAFVRDNNLVMLNLKTKEEKQLTFDGEEHILNGHFDWVYEEEFGVIEGWHWSPDGKYIAYWQLDENRVPEFNIAHYDSLHLNWNHMRYPKAGDANSIVKIGVVHVKSGKNVLMDIGDFDDIYIPRIKWLPKGNQLALIRLNRLQNKAELLVGDISSGNTQIIFTDTDPKWIRLDDNWTFLKKSNQFIWTSERDGFKHIYLCDLKSQSVKQITRGAWEVRTVEAVDEKKQWIYFMAAKDTPLENHLYRVDFRGEKITRLTKTPGWHRVQFSPDRQHYIDTYSQANVAAKTALFTAEGELKSVLIENEMETLKKFALSKKEFFSFKTSDGVKLNGWMIKPVNFNPAKKYPVLMYVYGGPGSQTVRNSWDGSRYLWFQLLAQKGYLIASIDNRGTGGRGTEFKKITYKNLGYWEVHDQIEGARYLGSLPYIDAQRMGIFGWSYGGYMASFCLFKGHDVFKAAIAGAPVTHWKFYDTIYTERYMQTPHLNPQGYHDSAPLNYAKHLRGKLLVVHGTDDDNVHFQNSVSLVNELIKHHKQFETMFYPGEYHGIRKGRLHLYTLMTNFILNQI
ncbi:MAG: DPP IV N-terminal domain-containing protein [bacterium]